MSDTLTRRELWRSRTPSAALADDLAGLDAAQWARPSLCGRWTVQETLAHMTAAASVGRVRWLASVLGARFDFDLHNDRRLAEYRGAGPGDAGPVPPHHRQYHLDVRADRGVAG
ncbi:maleylpyruvate isomerase N-terminal domain-containing protein [Micromonospora sp. BRA006-A]|nr:maleylpyruvate isomerase N-terminal domain-containing protein [Micromonospora sp. BRA006-A]